MIRKGSGKSSRSDTNTAAAERLANYGEPGQGIPAAGSAGVGSPDAEGAYGLGPDVVGDLTAALDTLSTSTAHTHPKEGGLRQVMKVNWTAHFCIKID